MYYSLAIGHHVGVIDCLSVAFRCPLTEYEDWLALVEEEQARRKMLGVMTFGEIVIDASHTALLTGHSRHWQMTRCRRGRRVAFNSFICWMKLCRNRPSI